MFDAPASVLTNVRGWETEREQRALKYLAERVPNEGSIVEIGSEYGMSTSIFAMYSKQLVHVSAIDPWIDPDIFHAHARAMREIGVIDKVVYYRMYSEGASSLYGTVDARPIDLLFIDGDHSTEAVETDIRLWTKRVVLGGVVVFHDTLAYTNERAHEQHAWVQAAIDRWVEQDNRIPYNNRFVEVAPVDSMRIFVAVRES